jgi:hypothetical protein
VEVIVDRLRIFSIKTPNKKLPRKTSPVQPGRQGKKEVKMENKAKKYIRFHREKIGPNYTYHFFEIKDTPETENEKWYPIPKVGCIAYYSYPMDKRDYWYFVNENGEKTRIMMSYEEFNKALNILRAEAVELSIPANFDVLTPELITKFSILEPANPLYSWWHKQAWYIRWLKEHIDNLEEIYKEVGEKETRKMWKKAVEMAKKYNSNDKEGIQYYAENYFKHLIKEKHLCCYLDLAEYIILRENFHI